MARIIAVTDAVKSLSEVEARFGLRRAEDEQFFNEWQQDLPELNDAERSKLQILRQRLLYHRAEGDLLEGSVMLLVASPLLELPGFYDPPFRMQAEAGIEVTVADGQEILRGRIDVLIMQRQFWTLVLESKKTTISTRSALPQALAYMMATPDPEKAQFGMLTNGDDVLFIKLVLQPEKQYSLSRVFSLYTLTQEWQAALQVLKKLATLISG
ncbi:type I restriction enzyme HsdR N-terminal domain-containing protein [Oscillatoria sp. FACHB-1407]|uniref:type I restriction endonuclease n=1 Tax=Oscillatoria sp. FACHB-1407 TaxID=2692847 RepID=UPI0016836BD8|nr:type I restriction endonuclease [Oscillatoria sp. FACHB-1407]MBD2462293.1 type I restriction enzyme HsdR N-terminal domain-containing protein [Oscillatoria sp. FACHB-1407]